MPDRTMEEICDEYFSSISPIAHKIIAEKRKCMEKNKRNWERLTQDEKDALLDDWFIDPDLKIRYEIRLQGKLPINKDALPDNYPRLKVQGGTRTVHHTEHEDGSQSKGTCQQEMPMISPASITAASTIRNGLDYPENRYSLNLDATDESQLIVSSGKTKSKEMRRGTDNTEKPDKTRVSRKDSKKEEKAKEKERVREREKEIQQERERQPERESPVVSQQPKPAQSPLADMSLTMTDKNGKGPKRDKSDKAKSPKAPRSSRNSGKASPKREGRQKEKSFDMEGLLPSAASQKADRSIGGINFPLLGSGAAERDSAPSSPPPSAASLGSEKDSGQAEEGEEPTFDFLLQW